MLLSPEHPGPDLRRAFLQCKQTTRTYAKSFYFASHLLPASKRMAAYAVYGFCRFADNVVDSREAVDGADVRARIRILYEELDSVYIGGPLGRPELYALRSTVSEYEIPKEYFGFLLKGIGMDVEKSRYETLADLEEYSFCVASSVGMVMAHVLGNPSEPALAYARELGLAMQLTNILRDVREDFDMGRIYIPAEELRRYGVDEGVLAQRETPPELRELIRRLCEVAREHYRAAEPGIALLPDDGSRTCVSLMSALYSRILVKIRERDYNVLASRAHVPAVEKFGIAARMAMQTHRSERKHRCTNG